MATYWCFTLNNVHIPPWLTMGIPVGVRYLVCQLERGESGTPHLQGYVQLSRHQRMSWVRNHLSDKAHWEIMKAHNTDDARNYCMKCDTRIDGPWEFGKYVRSNRTHRGGRGKRNDIELFRDAIKGGMSESELWDTFPTQMARYPKMYTALHKPQKVRIPPKVILLYGPTGTGKTKWFYDNCPDDNWWASPISNGTLWMDGYGGEEWVLFDDFSGQMQLTQLLRLLDRHPVTVPVKGSHCDFSPTRTIVVTTNIHPRMWYKWNNRESQYAALARRFTRIIDSSSGTDRDRELVSVGDDGSILLGSFFEEGLLLESSRVRE